MSAAIRFYCGIGERQWNWYPVTPGPDACISPVYGNSTASKEINSVHVPAGVQVIQDSGAFSDGPGQRLNFVDALKRQERHAERYSYADQIEARASYDLLIDEMWDEAEGSSAVYRRTKRRWTETQAELAVQETIAAARFLSQHRNGLPCILSAQGVSPQQYRRCAEKIVPLMQENDVFGLGGWCITGKFPAQMQPVFRETLYSVIPFLGQEGIKRVHIWGVCFAPALGELLWLCDQHGVTLSTDSMGPSVRPAMGRWGYGDWTDTSYSSAPSLKPEEAQETSTVKGFAGNSIEIARARGAHRTEHVRQVRGWLKYFRHTVYYPKAMPLYLSRPRQLQLAM